MRGLGDYVMEDAQGVPRVIESQLGGAYPAAGTGPSKVDFARGSDRIGVLDLRLADWLEQALNLQDLAATLDAYANTYQPLLIGRTGIVVAAGVGATSGPLEEPVPGGCYFVIEGLAIGYDSGLSVSWTLQITRAAGQSDLFDEPMASQQFDESGAADGGYYKLPRRMVLYPNERITFILVNRDGANAINADIHLVGYKVAVATR
jgi:hypothetical protein